MRLNRQAKWGRLLEQLPLCQAICRCSHGVAHIHGRWDKFFILTYPRDNFTCPRLSLDKVLILRYPILGHWDSAADPILWQNNLNTDSPPRAQALLFCSGQRFLPWPIAKLQWTMVVLLHTAPLAAWTWIWCSISNAISSHVPGRRPCSTASCVVIYHSGIIGDILGVAMPYNNVPCPLASYLHL